MKWYDAVKDFLYVHSWLQALIFGSLISIAGGGSILYRRRELQHARDLVKANEEANTFRKEANRLSTGLLEVHTAQAATAELIGQALNQQGKVLDEQTKIMEKQFDLQRRTESKIERESVFTSAVEMQAALFVLERRMSRITLSNVSDKDVDEVTRYFENVSEKAGICMKALHLAVHISEEEKKYFSEYAQKLLDLQYRGDMRKALEDVKAKWSSIDTNHIFSARLGNLGKTPINMPEVKDVGSEAGPANVLSDGLNQTRPFPITGRDVER